MLLRLVGVVAAAAVVAGGALGASGAQAAPKTNGRTSRAPTADQFLDLASNMPEYGPIWKQMRQDFPQEAHRAAELALAQGTPERGRLVMGQYLARFMLDQTLTMSKASDADMRAFAGSSMKLYATLQRHSDQVCADVALGKGLAALTLDTPDVKAALRERAVVMLRTIHNGRSSPVSRKPVMAEDRAAFLARLSADGAPADVLAMQRGQTAMAAASPRLQCESTWRTMQALTELPLDQGGRLASMLLGRIGGDMSAGLDPEEFAALTSRKLLDEMEAEANTGASWRLLDQEFPGELNAMAQEALSVAKVRGMQSGIETLTARYAAFIVAHKPEAALGPDADLSRMADANAKLIKALQMDDEGRCALYGAKGVMPPQPMAAQVQLAAVGVNAVVVEALVDAHRTRTERTPPTQADLKLLVQQLGRLHSAPEVTQAMLSGVGFDRLPPRQQCQGSVDLMQAISDLPAEVGARLMATILTAPGKRKDAT